MVFRSQNEDLFEDTRMSFGEHLEELRKTLIRALAGLAVGCVIGFLLAEQVVSFLQTPLEISLSKFYLNQGRTLIRSERGFLSPDLDRWMEQNQAIPESVWIDRAELIASLSNEPIERGAAQPSLFRAEHFDPVKGAAFCRRWSEAAGDDSDVGRRLNRLWQLLDEPNRQKIQALAGVDSWTSTESAEMAEIVNKLIGMREVHQSQEFQTLIDPDRGFLGNLFLPNSDNLLRQMSEQLNSKFDLELSRELNQILIARAIGDAIRTDRGNFVRLIVWKASRVKSQSLGAAEPFMIWMKAGLITGLIISSPWVFYWLWVFVAAGLYPTEKRNVHLFLPISLLLFFAGVLLAFFFVFEPVLDFMFGFNARMGIEPQPRINDWLSFVLFLPLGFGIAFQLPLVMLFANRIGIIALETYWDKWRIAVVVIFGISMVLTPADPVSMILMAVPLTVLYFLGILLCRWFSRPANPFEAAS